MDRLFSPLRGILEVCTMPIGAALPETADRTTVRAVSALRPVASAADANSVTLRAVIKCVDAPVSDVAPVDAPVFGRALAAIPPKMAPAIGPVSGGA